MLFGSGLTADRINECLLVAEDLRITTFIKQQLNPSDEETHIKQSGFCFWPSERYKTPLCQKAMGSVSLEKLQIDRWRPTRTSNARVLFPNRPTSARLRWIYGWCRRFNSSPTRFNYTLHGNVSAFRHSLIDMSKSGEVCQVSLPIMRPFVSFTLLDSEGRKIFAVMMDGSRLNELVHAVFSLISF